ncbi:hypothetical protein EU527_04575 [Candidatus Thorarchaeota archaeon]|nr:MAG: hypothetical protein EU527_04575 [Candidatus Thorarchaeota archaeon]
MQQKRIVHISMLIFIVTMIIPQYISSVSTLESSTSGIVSTISETHENLTIHYPSEPITWYRNSQPNLLIWTITGNANDEILFVLFNNNTLEYSGSAQETSPFSSIHIFYRVPLFLMDYGTYNYTLAVTDNIDSSYATVMLYLVEGIANTGSLQSDLILFLTSSSVFTILGLVLLFGYSSFKKYLGR